MGALRGNPHLWGTWMVAVLGTCSGGWARVGTGGHGHSCHRCHTQSSVTHRLQVSHITHRIAEQCEWEGPSGDDPAQALPRQGHLEQVTLFQMGWDVSMEGDPAPSLGSCPRAWPFHGGGKFCLVLSWECWSSGPDSLSCLQAPLGCVWHHPQTLGRSWGLVESRLRYLYELVQSPQVRDLCGLRSSGSRSGTERALPGAAWEMEMAPGSAGDPERGDWGRQVGRGAAAGHGVEVQAAGRVGEHSHTPDSWGELISGGNCFCHLSSSSLHTDKSHCRQSSPRNAAVSGCRECLSLLLLLEDSGNNIACDVNRWRILKRSWRG